MKQYFFLTICLALLGISQAKAQAAKVALQHDGNITLYNADELQKALDASVDGDIIYLNEGTFQGGVTISKKVSVIGAGENTVIDGAISITASGTLTIPILDAMTIKDNISVFNSTTGLVIRKCKFWRFDPRAILEDATIDRCFQEDQAGRTGGIVLSANVRQLKVVNSKVSLVYGIPNNVANATFVNCNLYFSESSSYYRTLATFINCIIHNYYSPLTESLFSYCLMYKTHNSVNEQNCSYSSSLPWYTNVFDTITDKKGTDGTPAGIYGGTTPFTLVPSVPTVKSSDLKVDTENKKLNVNISVESN